LRNERIAKRGRATNVAKWASTTFLTWIGVGALALAIAAVPADAKKRKPDEAKPEDGIADLDTSEPMVLVVSLKQQKLDIYRGTTLVTTSQVSTGMPGHATKAGVFSILEKQRFHHSNIYSGAPMPWMNRITWSGTALHAGVVPGYPASHGCIRLPFSFAPKLFKITTVGDNVIVARDRPAPQLIEHPALFQPLPPAASPALVNQQPPQRQSMIPDLPPLAPHKPHPGVLARADLSGATTDVPSTIGVETTQSVGPSLSVEQPAPVEDTHAHAFDPFAGRPANQTAGASGHALDDEEDGAPAKPSVASTTPAKPVEQTPAPIPVKATAPVAAMPIPAAAPAEKAPVPAALSIPVKVEPAPAKVEPAPAKAEPEVTAKASPIPVPAPLPALAAPVAPVAAATPAPIASPEAAPTPVATATPVPETAPTPLPVPAAPVLAAVTPAAPPAVQAVATTPQASLAIASADIDAMPSISQAKLGAGAKAAAIQAAEPRSTAPLRILVTRRTQSDRIIGVQKLLADMGYLEAQNFDGTLGKATANAIKTFQRNNGMAETGAFNDELVKKIYAVAGKGEPPLGHLFVRQEFGRLFDGPVTFKDPETPLGTHIFTALNFAPGATKVQWMTISLQGDDSTAVLDRIEIPADLRQKIAERLTPGSSLIIGYTAIYTATLTKGSDFLVWAKDTPAKITSASLDTDATDAKPRKKKRNTVRRNTYDYSYRSNSPRTPNFRGYPSWPW
jgi:lipoprotein-anchoring transpeptidase ErfK/SrfK/peptidoglycan hydrolase-like protein with peptidoglycan-binding domain